MERMEMTVGEIMDMEASGAALTPIFEKCAVIEQCAVTAERLFGWRAHLPPPSNEPPLDAERIAQLLKG